MYLSETGVNTNLKDFSFDTQILPENVYGIKL